MRECVYKCCIFNLTCSFFSTVVFARTLYMCVSLLLAHVFVHERVDAISNLPGTDRRCENCPTLVERLFSQHSRDLQERVKHAEHVAVLQSQRLRRRRLRVLQPRGEHEQVATARQELGDSRRSRCVRLGQSLQKKAITISTIRRRDHVRGVLTSTNV